MNVKYDVSWFGMGGIGRYSEEIKKRIEDIYRVETFSISGNPASPFATLKLTLDMAFHRKSFYFLPGYIPPIGNKGRFVFTIHDLNHLDIPDNSGLLKRMFYKYIIKQGCRNSLKILTVSEFSKQKIVTWSGVDESKVIVTGNGVSNLYTPKESDSCENRKYYFCVSNRKSHKNEKRILQSFAEANIDKNICLVMTGSPTEELNKLVVSLGLVKNVEFTGYLTENELAKFYRNAHALIFPSLYEGFGIPVLEAMASGIPVITSKTTSLPEVAGDAAILVDPTSTTEIKNAIEKLETNNELRKEMIGKGLQQSEKFSWEAVVSIIEREIFMGRSDSY